MNPALLHARVVENIIQFIGEYYEVHGVGCNGRSLSIRYAKRLRLLGGFQETMLELAKCGAITAIMKRTGGYLYYPEGAEINEDAAKVALTR